MDLDETFTEASDGCSLQSDTSPGSSRMSMLDDMLIHDFENWIFLSIGKLSKEELRKRGTITPQISNETYFENWWQGLHSKQFLTLIQK